VEALFVAAGLGLSLSFFFLQRATFCWMGFWPAGLWKKHHGLVLVVNRREKGLSEQGVVMLPPSHCSWWRDGWYGGNTVQSL